MKTKEKAFCFLFSTATLFNHEGYLQDEIPDLMEAQEISVEYFTSQDLTPSSMKGISNPPPNRYKIEDVQNSLGQMNQKSRDELPGLGHLSGPSVYYWASVWAILIARLFNKGYGDVTLNVAGVTVVHYLLWRNGVSFSDEKQVPDGLTLNEWNWMNDHIQHGTFLTSIDQYYSVMKHQITIALALGVCLNVKNFGVFL